ncbi:MAG: bifunctional phosphoribosylaminoimidazolecarboxamide formyltransferase/IMP cyclohydrolase [Elusimicrobia bacterium]|nr:bifunctional phosphoribosylaminoimidazolecarboxamide formyltransferase/IMP cyclohydrolase [Elusimicrobiota bacterium]
MNVTGRIRGIKIRRALISAGSKKKIEKFARFLAGRKIAIYATTGTVVHLKKKGIAATDVSKIVGSQILSGRVKTLSRGIFAGILADRGNAAHMGELKKTNVPAFDLVCVIPYKFGALPESIDIGGISLLRAAAKNHKFVVPVFEVRDFETVEREIAENGFVSFETSRFLAAKTFFFTGEYDRKIGMKVFGSLREKEFPNFFEKLRYGENPGSSAFLYSIPATFRQISGKKISLNNIVDMDAAFSLASEFRKPAVAVVKHRNPCGVACAEVISVALSEAFSADSQSAFGGVFGFNREVDGKSAKFLKDKFVDCIIAPGFGKEALKILRVKKTVLAIVRPCEKTEILKDTSFGKVAEKISRKSLNIKVVTKKKPTSLQMKDLVFAWKVVKHTTSNAIVAAKNEKTVAICGGSQSRVRAVEVCSSYSGRRRGLVLASDGFFPFPDSVAAASKIGVKAIIQPGGSIRDRDVIKEADRRKIAMVFTGQRCFLH